MEREQQLRELAAKGYTARMVAEEMGVARQYVYALAQKFGVSLARYHDRQKKPRAPRPRVITGGVAQLISHTTAGTISELLAAADLMARGWQVFYPFVHNKGHDLLAVKDREIITVEVRSAYRNGAGKLIFAKRADCKSDRYALVVTGEPVSYEPPFAGEEQSVRTC